MLENEENVRCRGHLLLAGNALREPQQPQLFVRRTVATKLTPDETEFASPKRITKNGSVLPGNDRLRACSSAAKVHFCSELRRLMPIPFYRVSLTKLDTTARDYHPMSRVEGHEIILR